MSDRRFLLISKNTIKTVSAMYMYHFAPSYCKIYNFSHRITAVEFSSVSSALLASIGCKTRLLVLFIWSIFATNYLVYLFYFDYSLIICWGYNYWTILSVGAFCNNCRILSSSKMLESLSPPNNFWKRHGPTRLGHCPSRRLQICMGPPCQWHGPLRHIHLLILLLGGFFFFTIYSHHIFSMLICAVEKN